MKFILPLKALLAGAALTLFSFSAQALVVLQYHHISESTPKATSTPPALFEQHLDYLVENDFDVISMAKLAELVREGEPLPDKTAVISFDDGYSSVFHEAWPRLRKRNLPFTVFINTEPHNQANPSFMSWEQMREMAEEGVIFANHSVSHPHLIRRSESESKTDWLKRIKKEISQAERTIEEELNQSHRLFAYPFGEYNKDVQKLLEEAGFLAFGQQSGPVAEYSHPQALPRFPFGGVYGGMDGFKTKVNTRAMPLRRAIVRTEKGAQLDEPELPSKIERPELQLILHDAALAKRVNCFASGQGAIPAKVTEAAIKAQAPQALPSGRSRYNCTAPTGETGRYFWYSEMFIRRLPDGSWYTE